MPKNVHVREFSTRLVCLDLFSALCLNSTVSKEQIGFFVSIIGEFCFLDEQSLGVPLLELAFYNRDSQY